MKIEYCTEQFSVNKLLLVILTCALILPATAVAQLSPGDLTEVHAHLEGVANCTKCHESGNRSAADKCLECHEILAQRINENSGLHAGEDYQDCHTCHVEHQGREYDLIYWPEGMENFDHAKTGYALEGAHNKLKCRDCHREGHIEQPERLKKHQKDLQQTFLGLSGECLSCHHDEHRGQLAKNCRECHQMQNWKPAALFDHGKTDFILTGAHKKTDCLKCHPITRDKPLENDETFVRYTNIAHQTCTDCHKDAHSGRLGSNCQKCHDTKSWQTVDRKNFNHDLTRYPLRGRHVNLRCEQCHKPGQPMKIEKFQQCSDCHDDYHQGQLSAKYKLQCDTCHTVAGFSPSTYTVSNHQKSAFPLKGAHLAVPCFLCHKKIPTGSTETTQMRFESTRCAACHTDIHAGSVDQLMNRPSDLTGESGCGFCHEVSGWNRVAFDHSLTEFKLIGKHDSVSCINCHPYAAGEERQLRFKTKQKQCADCHSDIHAGQFAGNSKQTVCDRCHTPFNWQATKFDHNRDAEFKLAGAHQKVECGGCHKTEYINEKEVVRYKPLERECKSCHGKEEREI